jgi:hypothetical protein
MRVHHHNHSRNGRALRVSLQLFVATSFYMSSMAATYLKPGPTEMRVDYCRIVEQPSAFQNTDLTVSATYRYGFEWSELYCMACLNPGRTWVDFDPSVEDSTPSAFLKRLRQSSDLGRTANVVFTGRFQAPGSYGHGNAYRFRFLVRFVREVKIVFKDGRVPEQLPADAQSKVCADRRHHAAAHYNGEAH